MEVNSDKREEEGDFNSDRKPLSQNKQSETDFNLPKIQNNPSTVSI